MSAFQRLLVLGCLSLSLRAAIAEMLYSDGESGQPCGPEGLRCLRTQAECFNNTCRCLTTKKKPFGKGLLNCHRDSERVAGAVNDPAMLTFDGPVADLPISCRYLLARVKSTLMSNNNPDIGECETEVYTFHGKDKGKFYVKGFDIAIRISFDQPPVTGSPVLLSMRVIGKAVNGSYAYQLNTTANQYLPNGPWNDDIFYYKDPVTKVQANRALKADDNIIAINVARCGIRIRFRAYDIGYRRHTKMVPGIQLAANDYNNAIYVNETESVGFLPDDNYPYFNAHKSIKLIHKALTSGIQQNQPEDTDDHTECTDAGDVLDGCSEANRYKAYKNCLWILKSPRFINCYDGTNSGEFIMRLFRKCAEIYCTGAPCQPVIDMINTSVCDSVPGYDDLDDFVLGLKCP